MTWQRKELCGTAAERFQPVANGAAGKVHDFANFLVGQALDKMHHGYLRFFFARCVQYLFYVYEIVRGRRSRVSCNALLHLHVRSARAQPLNGQTRSDAIQNRRWVIHTVLVGVSDELNEAFLGDILCELSVAQDTPTRMPKHRGMLAIELGDVDLCGFRGQNRAAASPAGCWHAGENHELTLRSPAESKKAACKVTWMRATCLR